MLSRHGKAYGNSFGKTFAMTRSGSPPKVLVVSHGFQQAYERGFVNALAHLGMKVELVSSNRTDQARIDTRVALLNLRRSQEENRGAFRKALNMARYHLALLGLALTRRHAIIHVIGLLDYPVLTGIVEGLFFRTVFHRYALTVHDILPHDRHTLWHRLLCHLIYRIPHALVVHTERMKEELCTRFGVSATKVFIMEHGCEMELMGLPVEVSSAPREGGDERFSLLFFGMVKPYKGVDLLLSTFSKLESHFVLSIAGRCTDSAYASELQTTIAASPARDRIAWRNEFVPEEEIAGIFAAADALVLPYRHIDQSGVLFQAFRFGIPVVASRVGEFGRYVSKDYGEVFTAGDVDDLVAALRRAYRRRREFSREKIISRAREFDWRKTVTALQPVYWHKSG